MRTLSIAELARIVHPTASRHRGMALLRAYFDESGIHSSSKVIMVGGMVGIPEQWAALEIDWNQLLVNVGLPYFHATECAAGSGIYTQLHSQIRKDLFVNFSRLFLKHNFSAVNGAVWRSEWEKFKAGSNSKNYPEPYYLCFHYCVEQLSKWSTEHANGEPIAIVFASQADYSQRALATYEAIKAGSPWRGFLGSLTFADAKEYPALQAADLIAYEFYQYAVHHHKQTPKPAFRPAFQILVEANMMLIGGFLEMEEIDKHLSEVESRRGRTYTLPPFGRRG